MRGKDVFHLCRQQLCFHKMRSILCLSAVAIGIYALLLISNAGTFASSQIDQSLDTLGLQGMTLYLEDPEPGEFLTAAFAEQLEEEIGQITTATPIKFALGTFRSGQKKGNVILIGCEEDIGQSLGISMMHGQSIPAQPIVDIPNPIVISEHFAHTLHQRSNVIGKQFYLTVDGVQDRYTVVGVIEDQISALNTALGGNMPELAYVSLTKLAADGRADQILFSTDTPLSVIRSTLQDTVGRMFGMQSALGVQDLSGYREQIMDITHKAQFFLLVFASFGIAISAFAIVNSMMASIQEMRSEILLYRMIGLRKIDIVRFVFGLAGLLCLAGAALGTVLGFVTIQIVQEFFLPGFTFQIESLLIACITSGALSILAGIFPVLQVFSSIQKEQYDLK